MMNYDELWQKLSWLIEMLDKNIDDKTQLTTLLQGAEPLSTKSSEWCLVLQTIDRCSEQDGPIQ